MKKTHLYEIDLMRAFIILGVVCVHVISFFDTQTKAFTPTNIGFEAALSAFHFTRESFMFITGLVLFHTYYHRQFKASSFWLKRFKLIAIPYIAWTALYILFEGTYLHHFSWAPQALLGKFATALATGNQFFLYYLLLTMQLYLVFPWMVKLLKKSESIHGWLFAGSFALELGLMAFNQFYLQGLNTHLLPGWLAFIVQFRDRFVLTYQFWFVAGAIFSIHYDQIYTWFQRRFLVVLGGFALMLSVLWAHFAFDRLYLHDSESMSVLVLQPIMIPYSFAVTLLLWQAGVKWSRARLESGHRLLNRFIQFFAGASFGIFLVHPLALHFVEVAEYALHPLPALRLPLVVVSIGFVYFSSGLLAYAIGRVPWLSYIVGVKTKLHRDAKTSAPKTAATTSH
ncbi:acyltransferase [Alicyclobacillus tolerans]|uniref:acyltransferase n=1 Tax=Alicyclobacillus tolerans TaxID=90970 RepID=UPI001F469FA2|nr:acyltransferase [Alicyclobacillus tolerans]MCF8565912.1 acyltransferase [Alicyclobacillus tolerans]